jgi:hypothetical protein
MLADFQQALADLVASPARCQAVRDGDGSMLQGYQLTDRERTRLVGMARQPAMAANCMVYRSNRLTPLVLNLADTCSALGPRLREVLDDYWDDNPTDNFVHFLIETDRFVCYLESIVDTLGEEAVDALRRESAVVRERLGL